MSPRPFVPLHLHTEYSILDGATKIKDLIAHAKDKNMPAIAITDHGCMYGSIAFYQQCKSAGIKPIIGCEVYTIDGDITEKKTPSGRMGSYNHLVLLAKDYKGYQNLTKLVSKSYIDGFYYKPRINYEILSEHTEGLIAMSACLGGDVNQSLLKGKYDEALEKAKYLKELFGEDFYLEIQDHGMEEQKQINPDIVNLGKELDIQIVATNDSHYTKKEDYLAHDILLCLQTGKTFDDPDRMRFPSKEFYVKDGDEMAQMFKNLDPDDVFIAIDNTLKIAEKCSITLPLGKTVLPYYPVPANHTDESYLNKIAREGLEKRYKEITPEIEERFKYELSIIEQMGFAAYFLIVSDFIQYSKNNEIPVGPGRGSAAGSLVAYCLGITDLDPLEHGLLFERFLNPERISMPDVDIDFCIEKRDKAIEYVTNKYGKDKVCQIITFGTLAARAAVKGVARVLDYPFAESNKIAAMIPQAPGITIDDALQEGQELRKLYDKDERIKHWIDLAKSIEGINCNIGTHAAGVIIARDPLSTVVPIQKSKDDIVITQYAMADAEKVGLLKMDFLGLRNLTIIHNTLKSVKENFNIDITMSEVPLDDKPTYDLLSAGETDGVFQLESSGMKMLVKDLKPNVFNDVGALVALFRPGPLESGMVKDFVLRKHGKQKIEYDHPLLEDILEDTYGTIVYQEQIMQIAQRLAGYTLGQADILRKAMGKKKKEEMDKQKEVFLDGAAKNGIDPDIARELFDKMAKFASYCFNRAHSAAYALLAYHTAYLKCHYPKEYMAALLSSVRDRQDKIQLYIGECQKMGIEVLPPDINQSGVDFTPAKDGIRFGLASVKNVGVAVVEAIKENRKDGKYESLYDFCLKMGDTNLNTRTLESLIKCGAFTTIEKSRKQLLENLEGLKQAADREKSRKASGQISLFNLLDASEPDSSFTSSYQLVGEETEFSDGEIQALEKELLGFYVTSHPLSTIKKHLPVMTTHEIAELGNLKEDTFVAIAGLVSSMRQILTKNNKLMKIGVLEDLSGTVDIVSYNETVEKYGYMLEEDARLIIKGKIKYRGDEEVSVNVVVEEAKSIETAKIFNVTVIDEADFSEIQELKNIMLRYKGSDPVIVNMNNNDKPLSMVTNSRFWVSASDELAGVIKGRIGNKFNCKCESINNN
ncbi:MAG: DNA polymerase III subunit alpha [Vampirovibrionia bacterium]